MRRTIATIAFILALPIFCYCQTETTGTLKNNNIIELTFSNSISNEITAHTFKYFGEKSQVVHNYDSNPAAQGSKIIESIINLFLGTEGVTRCTFDKATQTFTVLSAPATNLNEVARSINEK